MNERFDGTPPVKVGDSLDVQIEAVGSKGDGIAKVQGFVLFVPGVNEGDQVKIKITRVLSKVGFAEVVGKAAPRAKQQEPEPEPEDEEPEVVEDTEDFGEELDKD